MGFELGRRLERLAAPALLGALVGGAIIGSATPAFAQMRGGGGPAMGRMPGPAMGMGGGFGAAMPGAATARRGDDPQPGSLRDFLFGSKSGDKRAMPATARFNLDSGDGFVLDRSGGVALLKFEDSAEVWALTAMAGPRGDTIFKNDVGEQMLRINRIGGVTLFTEGRPDGLAVSLAGPASTVKPNTTIGPSVLFQVLAQASLRASHAAQHLIPFVVAQDATPKTDWLFADAAGVASEALVRLCSEQNGRSVAAHLARVEFQAGGAAQAVMSGSVVQITVVPSKGLAGRPSSERIYLVLRQR